MLANETSGDECLRRGSQTEVWLLGQRPDDRDRNGRPYRRLRKSLMGFANVETERRRLKREAQLHRLATGRGVPELLDDAGDGLPSAHSQDGISKFDRRYIEGATLREWCLHTGPTAYERSLVAQRLVAGLCETLARLHELRISDGMREGLLHRDVTPANVLIEPGKDGRNPSVWLIDFGLSRLRDWEDLTQEEIPMGTPRFLPPELTRGEQPSCAADVYQAALCLVSCQSHFQADKAHNPTLPRALKDALSPRPEDRPSARELAEALYL